MEIAVPLIFEFKDHLGRGSNGSLGAFYNWKHSSYA